jgi:hypothetical protein
MVSPVFSLRKLLRRNYNELTKNTTQDLFLWGIAEQFSSHRFLKDMQENPLLRRTVVS